MFGLPLISPLNEVYSAWNTIIILLDSTYTAFLVPILVGFNVSDVTWTWGCIIDLVCGVPLPRLAMTLRACYAPVPRLYSLYRSGSPQGDVGGQACQHLPLPGPYPA